MMLGGGHMILGGGHMMLGGGHMTAGWWSHDAGWWSYDWSFEYSCNFVWHIAIPSLVEEYSETY